MAVAFPRSYSAAHFLLVHSHLTYPNCERVRILQCLTVEAMPFRMSTPPYEARRRGLMQQYMPLDLSTNWETPQVVRAKSVRSVALTGASTHSPYGLVLRNPFGIIELIGSRTGLYSTVMLAVFSPTIDETIPKFSIEGKTALGTMFLPVESFAGFLQIVSCSSVYFRMGGSGDDNAIANDSVMLQF